MSRQDADNPDLLSFASLSLTSPPQPESSCDPNLLSLSSLSLNEVSAAAAAAVAVAAQPAAAAAAAASPIPAANQPIASRQADVAQVAGQIENSCDRDRLPAPGSPPAVAASAAASAAVSAQPAAAAPSSSAASSSFAASLSPLSAAQFLAAQQANVAKVAQQLDPHRPLFDGLFGSPGAPPHPRPTHEMVPKLTGSSILYLKEACYEISAARREWKDLIAFLYYQHPCFFIIYHDQIVAAFIRYVTPFLELNRQEQYAPVLYKTITLPKPRPLEQAQRAIHRTLEG